MSEVSSSSGCGSGSISGIAFDSWQETKKISGRCFTVDDEAGFLCVVVVVVVIAVIVVAVVVVVVIAVVVVIVIVVIVVAVVVIVVVVVIVIVVVINLAILTNFITKLKRRSTTVELLQSSCTGISFPHTSGKHFS